MFICVSLKKKHKTSFTHTLSHHQQHEMQPDGPQVTRGQASGSLGCPHLALVQVYSLPGISLQGDITQRLTAFAAEGHQLHPASSRVHAYLAQHTPSSLIQKEPGNQRWGGGCSPSSPGSEVGPRYKPRFGLKVKTFYCTRLGHLSSELRLLRGTQIPWARREHWGLSGEAFGGMQAGGTTLPLSSLNPTSTQAKKYAFIFLVCVCHQSSIAFLQQASFLNLFSFCNLRIFILGFVAVLLYGDFLK